MEIVINPHYNNLKSFVFSLPQCFETEGETIYDERNKLKRFQVDGVDVVVKRFKKPHIINRIAYSFFRPSKAERSYKHSLLLLKNGVNSPEPIAYMVIKKWGIIQYSYYVSIFESEFSHIRKQMAGEEGSDEFIRQFTAFVADLHAKGILNLDLSPGNVLFKWVGEKIIFTLVDVNRMAFVKKIPIEVCYQNFQRLSNNKRVVTAIAKNYAHICGLDEQITVKRMIWYVDKFQNR